MSVERPPRPRSWHVKFADAFRGVRDEIRTQSSFRVHFAAAVAVVVAGFLLKVSPLEWSLLVLCITGVWVAEMFNTALEALARAISLEPNPQIRLALDVASAAVLMASLGAAVVGAIVLGHAAWR